MCEMCVFTLNEDNTKWEGERESEKNEYIMKNDTVSSIHIWNNSMKSIYVCTYIWWLLCVRFGKKRRQNTTDRHAYKSSHRQNFKRRSETGAKKKKKSIAFIDRVVCQMARFRIYNKTESYFLWPNNRKAKGDKIASLFLCSTHVHCIARSYIQIDESS